MGTAILVVTKQMSGEEWSNTYGISVGSDAGPADEADIASIIATNPADGLIGTTTNPSDPAYAGNTSIIAAILGFERLMHFPSVQFTRLNLSDATTPGTPTGPFWSQTIAFTGVNGISSPIAEAAIAPLSVALLVNRNTNELGVRPGRLYYRACLGDANVRPGSRVGVTWSDSTTQTDISALVISNYAAASMGDYSNLTGGPLPAIYLSIPHMVASGDSEVIASAVPVSRFTANKPVSRQLTRGRRRRVAA